MYRISYERHAERELLSLPRDVARRIAVAIDTLADEPRPPGCRKVVGADNIYRIRVGRYRIIYEVLDDEKLNVILSVRIRTETTYRDL